jgi:hypothetical protein
VCRANSQGESLGTTGRLLITYDAGIKKDGSYSWSAFLGIRVDRRDYTKMLDVNTARNGMALGKAGTSWDKLGQAGTGWDRHSNNDTGNEDYLILLQL